MTRLVLLAFLCLGASISSAEGTLSGGATLKFNRLLLHENNSATLAEPEVDPDSLWKYFNLAHCVCSLFNSDPGTADPAFFEKSFAYELTVENATTPIERPVEVWVGTDCNTMDPAIRMANCTKITTTPNVSAIDAAGSTNLEIPIYDLMTPATADRSGCQERVLSGTTWVMVDEDADNKFEYSESTPLETDSQAPPLPINFRAVGAENAIEISWDPPTEGVADIAYYQALCSTESGSPAKSDPPAPRYQTPFMLCGAQQNIALTPSDIATNTEDPDAGAVDITQLGALPAEYICGESASATATNMRIEGLTNGTPYTVVLLAIDKHGNANGTYFTSRLIPVPSTDFWEDLHDQGSDVEGGFCLISQAYGDGNPLTNLLRGFRDSTLAKTGFGRWLIDVYYGTIGALDLHGSIVLRVVVGVLLLPLVVLALAWHLLTLPGLLALAALLVIARKRRLRGLAGKRLAIAATVATIALVPALAGAQTPYWEDQTIAEADEEELLPGDPRRVKWHAGLRLGPYVPGIDAQLDMPVAGKDGPYEQMFGGYSIMPVIDVERFLWRGFGQLGVGLSIGYMGKKAHPWQAGSDPMDPDRPRADGDNNTFRLVPFALSAVYRLSVLDDEYGVPLVPYGRVGLGYYVWWATAPSGDFAKACVGGGSADGCETTRAAGASLGVVGSVGLAIRAERIDENAARSMRESGIEHAGFYAEYSIGKVDGFGSSKKLSVGDATWFAGIDFEF